MWKLIKLVHSWPHDSPLCFPCFFFLWWMDGTLIKPVRYTLHEKWFIIRHSPRVRRTREREVGQTLNDKVLRQDNLSNLLIQDTFWQT